jgi:hypothetical protein
MSPSEAGVTPPKCFDVISSPLPKSPLGYGHENVSFWSDASELAIDYSPSQLGAMRVTVNGIAIARIGQLINGGRAQCAAPTDITLSPTASATDNFYSLNWITITSGRGAGQVRQNGHPTPSQLSYDGTMKVAYIIQPWDLLPNGSSTYNITESNVNATEPTNPSVEGYVDLRWTGEPQSRLYDVEVEGSWNGIYTSSAFDVVTAPQVSDSPICFWIGDSFSDGTGSDQIPSSSLASIACSQLGWTLWNLSIGGTGYLNPGKGSLTVPGRIIPPRNAWTFNLCNGTGSFAISQDGITTSKILVDGLTYQSIQSACNQAFGAGYFRVAGVAEGTESRWWLVCESDPGQDSTDAMNLTLDSFKAGNLAPTIWHSRGDLAPYVPTLNGVAQPFYIVFAEGHNDTTSSEPAHTSAGLNQVLNTLYTTIDEEYPTARVFVVGNMYLSGKPNPSIVACKQPN